jgi:hypothetical protein
MKNKKQLSRGRGQLHRLLGPFGELGWKDLIVEVLFIVLLMTPRKLLKSWLFEPCEYMRNLSHLRRSSSSMQSEARKKI